VKTTHVIYGDPVLGDIAEHAVKQWQFRPFILNGEPAQVDSRIVMKFSKKHAEVVVGER
jgi:outer membrane biosynthesis protein TonB